MDDLQPCLSPADPAATTLSQPEQWDTLIKGLSRVGSEPEDDPLRPCTPRRLRPPKGPIWSPATWSWTGERLDLRKSSIR